MNKSAFIKAAAALGLACGLVSPASAQVSNGLQQAAFGGGSGSTTPAATGFSALSTVGQTVTKQTGAGAATSEITTTSGGGGKVGTFTTSLSEGDQQRFAVGTSTNIGVNASASSTSDYQVNSNANLSFGTSNLRQTIGTSGIAQSQSERSSLAESYAANSASTSVGSSAERYYEKAQASGNANQNSGYAWWNSSYSGKSFNSLSSDEKQTITNSYNAAYTSASSAAKSDYSSSAAAQEASNGVISGSFVSSSNKTVDTAATPDVNNSAANNQVTVKGIGNAASVNAIGNSGFTSVVSARSGTPAAGSSGTASGSAGANVSSTASADAAATKFSSVYIQSY
jgi:hypothetical protein